MYTIREAAARTGLSVPTVRVWERRYGVVAPTRTPAGYRLFDDAAIARLVAMRRLIAEHGWQPRQAAQRVLEAGGDLRSISQLEPGPGPGTLGAVPDQTEAAGRGLIDVFVAAAGDLDVPAMERILDESFAAQRFELAVDEVVAPAMRAIGAAWEAGAMDVGAEHAASETVRRRLARFFDAAGRLGAPPQVIVGLPPGSHHEIGALAFAVAARRAGIEVIYLGSNVPVESWVVSALDTAAPMVVLGIVTPSDVKSASRVIKAVGALPNAPVCLIGGASAPGLRDAPSASRLPATIDAAVATVARVLEGRQT